MENEPPIIMGCPLTTNLIKIFLESGNKLSPPFKLLCKFNSLQKSQLWLSWAEHPVNLTHNIVFLY